MKLVSYAKTETGNVRARNEDAVLNSSACQLYAVADGIGGLQRGDEASSMTLHLLEMAAHEGMSGKAALTRCIQEINRKVYETGKKGDLSPGMGCTLTCLMIEQESAVIAHVGDSSAFRIRAGGIQLLTEAHTMAAHLNRNRHPGDTRPLPGYYENMLTRCIGLPGDIDIDCQEFSLLPEDRILLCSDGITKVLSSDFLKISCIDSATPKDWVHRLHKAVLAAGAPDNLSSVAVFRMN